MPEPMRPMPVVRPFRYPAWIVLSAVAVIAAAVYSTLSLPVYFPAAQKLAQAERLDAGGDHKGAETLFRDVLATSPQSQKARIGLAKALFAEGGQAGNEAMQLLTGLELSNSDWDELKAVMPPEDQAQFHPVKR